MGTSTYCIDKLIKQINSIHSSRRDFLRASTAAGISLLAFGGIGALSGYANALKTAVKNPQQKEILDLMWGPSTPDRVDRLLKIMDQAIALKDENLAREAAEGLVPHGATDENDLHVVERLIMAFNVFSDNQKLQLYVIQLLALNYSINNWRSRLAILKFNWTQMPYKQNRVIALERMAFSLLMTIGLMGYRQLRNLQRRMRLVDVGGNELAQEFYVGYMLWYITSTVNRLFSVDPEQGALDTFKDRKDRFLSGGGVPRDHSDVRREFMIRASGLANALIIPSRPPKKRKDQMAADLKAYSYENNKVAWREKVEDWRQKLESGSPANRNIDWAERINALLSLDERNSMPADAEDRKLLLRMLSDENEHPQVKMQVLLIFGSFLPLCQDDINMIVNYLLNDPDKDMVLAAARGLRFRKNLPAKQILNFLEYKKQENEKFGQHLEDLLLSSLDSSDALKVLVLSIFKTIQTKPNNRADIRRRLEELRILYLRCGDSRDSMVIEAFGSAPRDVVDEFTSFLRDISRISIWRQMPAVMFVPSPTVYDGGMMTGLPEREANLEVDIANFEKIIEELIKTSNNAFLPPNIQKSSFDNDAK